MAQHTPMINQYLEIKNEYADAFLFFRLGDFYELFFDDAVNAARELEITLTHRTGGSKEKIPMCGVPFHTAEPYIRKLIEKGYKVAICEQTEDPKQAKGVVKREVIRVVTPGTVMEDSMLSDHEANYLLSVAESGGMYALVACELTTGERVGTCCSNKETFYSEIARYGAHEMVVHDPLCQSLATELSDRFSSCLLVSRELVQDDDGQAHEPDIASEKDMHNEAALQCAHRLMMQYIQETQKRSLHHLQPLKRYELEQYVRLDTQAMRNLELLETLRDRKKNGSLYWLLDETMTAPGARLLKRWIQQPLMDQAQIEQRMDVVQLLVEYSLERTELRDTLQQVYDLERLAARVSYGNISPREFVQLKQTLQTIPAINEQLQALPANYLQGAFVTAHTCQDVAALLDRALEERPPITIREGGIFRSGYDSELDKLREADQDGKKWIAELEQREKARTGIKTLKVGYNKVFGYYIEVTKANVHLLQEGEYERKQTLTNAERYITPELKEKEALILEASERLQDLEYELFVDLRQRVEQYIDSLQYLARIVAQLDVLCAFAEVSERYRYVRPTFTESDQLRIAQGRHPVLEKVIGTATFVANDTIMDRQKREVLLITGPNMAGKSTYMRQTALIAIMAQIGCFVPANEAELPIFDRIFTRIGAADDLVGGHSTFMLEMVETRKAIAEATENSLILLDEIGRGTSTYDGMSLAQAIIEYIHDHVRAKTLFSTHYHELTDLEVELSRLHNIYVACTEKEGRVTFLHAVHDGRADQSYGIQVARLAELPESIIERASRILAQFERVEGTRDKADNKTGAEQLSFFETAATSESRAADATNDYLFEEIKQYDIANMTPIEALNTLFSIQQLLKSKK